MIRVQCAHKMAVFLSCFHWSKPKIKLEDFYSAGVSHVTPGNNVYSQRMMFHSLEFPLKLHLHFTCYVSGVCEGINQKLVQSRWSVMGGNWCTDPGIHSRRSLTACALSASVFPVTRYWFKLKCFFMLQYFYIPAFKIRW